MRPDGERQSFLQALVNAGRGFAFGVRHERNVQIDCAFAAFAIALGCFFRIAAEQWLAVVVCIGMVLSLELVNTALEALTDLASPEFHPLAGRAKDCAAGACLVASACAFVVGVVIFAPRVLELFF